MACDVKWIKIVTDIFDDEKILLIESMPEADSIIVIWFKLLTLAGKQNNNGVFMLSNRIPYTDEMLSVIFRRSLNIVRLALHTFERFGMIEIADGVVTIPSWGKHQTLDAYEKKKDRDRLYSQNRRAEQKALAAGEALTAFPAQSGQPSDGILDNRPVPDDASPDASPDVAVVEEEREEEKEKEKRECRENRPTLFERLLPGYALSDAVREKLGDWINIHM